MTTSSGALPVTPDEPGSPAVDERTPPFPAPARFRGEWLTNVDPGYESACVVFNDRVQGRPAVIARCVGTSDVAAAIAVARDMGLELSVRGGGHSIGGWSSNTGGLVVDLTLMRHVRVAPENRTAWVGGGALAGDVLVAAAAHDLVAVTGALPSIGITGLTTGLGEGYLAPRYGFGFDHILALELVTADGDVRMVTADTDPDLFWAMRGAGPNFGVVTSLQLRLHEAPRQALRGMVQFHSSETERVLERAWDVLEHGSDEFWPGFSIGLDEDGAVAVTMILAHTGPAEAAHRDVDEFCEGLNVLNSVRSDGSYLDLIFEPMEFRARQEWDMVRFPFGADHRRQIKELLGHLRSGEGVGARSFTLWRSLASDLYALPSAAPRLFGITALISAWWLDSANDEAEIAWARESGDALRRSGLAEEAGAAMNHISVADPERVRGLYGDVAFQRLRELKRLHDPSNVFRRNFNISPSR